MAPKSEALFNLKPPMGAVAPVDPDEIEEGSPLEAVEADEGDDQSEQGNGDDFLSMIGKAEKQETAPLPKMDELTVLKDRARLMGISFSNNIGAEALAAKIKEKLDADRDQDKKNAALAAELVANMDDEDGDEQDGDEDLIAAEEQDHAKAVREAKQAMGRPVKGETTVLPGHLRNKTVRATTVRQRLLLEAKKLVRCRITCMNPAKKDLHGEIITVANGVVGTVRKFIPFGESTENGFMMEQFIFNMLQKRKYLQVRVKMVNGREKVESKWVKEFALEILPLPTPEELAQLATAQLAAGSLENQQ